MTAQSNPAKRGKFDFGAEFTELNEEATSRSEARFASTDGASRAERASRLVAQLPSAFTQPARNAQVPAIVEPTATSGEPKEVPLFDPGSYVVGREYRVPISMIDQNSWGARVYYKTSDVDRISMSFEKAQSDDEKQRVAVNAFVKADGRVELIDGGTRLRSAKSSGLATLTVKLERPPSSAREQFKRSKDLNEERSEHTALDLAVQFRRLLEEKVYESQDELAADMTDRKGNPLTKSQVSMYLRISRIPDRLRRMMVEHDQTSAFTIAYEISALCSQPDYATAQDQYDQHLEEVVREVQTKGLSKQQVTALVQSKLKGPRSRTRPEAMKVRYGDHHGTLKVFESRGQLDFSIRGLPAEKLAELKHAIEKICTSPAS